MKKYVSLFLAVIFFTGLITHVPIAELQWFNFEVLLGKFGTIAAGAKAGIVGSGGFGVRAAFIQCLVLLPLVMFALGCMQMFIDYGAEEASQKLITPILKPILGIPGRCYLAILGGYQNTDAGAALIKQLKDEGTITLKERVILTGTHFSAPATICNYFTTVGLLFSFFIVPIWIPLVVQMAMKWVNGIITRIIVNTVFKKDFAE